MCSFRWPYTWHHQAVELVQEIGRRTANTTLQAMPGCPTFCSMASAVRGTTEGECGLISKHLHRQLAHCNQLFHFLNVLCLYMLCAGGPKIIIIKFLQRSIIVTLYIEA